MQADDALVATRSFQPGTSWGSLGGLRVSLRLVAIVLGGLQVWAGRYSVGEDGVSYLDVGDAYLRGDWGHALNAYWSPLYSWILGVVLHVARPAAYWESCVVHAVNYAIFLLALASFEFLLRSCMRAWSERDHVEESGDSRALPEGAFLVLGYGMFLWASLQWISIPLESPDLLLSVFVYLAAGLLLRVRDGLAGWVSFALFGAVLGFGYLTKAAMFPLSFVFLGVAFLAVRHRPQAFQRVGLALLVFIMLAGPYALALSRSKGRLTFSDTGKLNYSWFANGSTDRIKHWNREFAGSRVLVHPMRRLMETPALYEFASPVGGTYPPWYDPSYWHEGVKPRFEPRGQLRVLSWSARDLWHMLVREEPIFLAGAFMLFFVGFAGWRRLASQIAAEWVLFVPALAAVGMYSVVLMSYRYVAAFVVLLWLGLLCAVRLPNTRESRRLGQAVAVVVLLAIALQWGPVSQLVSLSRSLAGRSQPLVHEQWEVANDLVRAGFRPGDTVVKIGYGANAYWARLARVRIVAELFSEDEDLGGVVGIANILTPEGSLRPDALEAFARTGAKGIVATKVSPEIAMRGWQQLGKTSWYAYLLR